MSGETDAETNYSKEHTMKRIFLALLAGVSVFGAVFGFAAAITTSSDNIGSGDATVNACLNAATASYNASYDAADGKYHVNSVKVTFASDACAGHTVGVTLTGPAASPNAVVGDGQLAVATAASDVTVLIDEKPLAASVVGVHLVVHNGASTNPAD